MKSDVKAVRKTSTGSVFGGRTRLRGIILASSGSAGSVTLQDGNSVTQFQVDVPAGDVFSYNLAEDEQGSFLKGNAIINISASKSKVIEAIGLNNATRLCASGKHTLYLMHDSCNGWFCR